MALLVTQVTGPCAGARTVAPTSAPRWRPGAPRRCLAPALCRMARGRPGRPAGWIAAGPCRAVACSHSAHGARQLWPVCRRSDRLGPPSNPPSWAVCSSNWPLAQNTSAPAGSARLWGRPWGRRYRVVRSVLELWQGRDGVGNEDIRACANGVKQGLQRRLRRAIATGTAAGQAHRSSAGWGAAVLVVLRGICICCAAEAWGMMAALLSVGNPAHEPGCCRFTAPVPPPGG